MNSKTMLKGACIALCLLGMLVLPAAAAPAGQMAKGNGSVIDQGLKDDLWANHQQYRLQGFDMNVQRATSVIAILNKYGVDTTTCQGTLATISGERSALETALSAKDQSGLKTINANLKTLWEQFRTEMKDAVKAHYGTRAKTTTAQSAVSSAANTAVSGIGI